MPGVIGSDETVHEPIAATLDARLAGDRALEPRGLDDHRLHAYAAPGVDSDHETVQEDALGEAARRDVGAVPRGLGRRDVGDLVKVLTEDGVDSRHVLLVTDDVHPETLVTVGHMNHVVRTAIDAASTRSSRSSRRRSTLRSTSALPRPRLDRAGTAARTSSSWRICARSVRTSCSPTGSPRLSGSRRSSIPARARLGPIKPGLTAATFAWRRRARPRRAGDRDDGRGACHRAPPVEALASTGRYEPPPSSISPRPPRSSATAVWNDRTGFVQGSRSGSAAPSRHGGPDNTTCSSSGK